MEKEIKQKAKESVVPGFAILCLFTVGILAAIGALAAPTGSLSGPAYLLVSALIFVYILQFCFRKN